MVKTFHISGIKCQGCVDTVTEKLSKVWGVTEVEVDLAKSEVRITGKTLPFLLQRALKGTKFELGKEV